jgi:hypothetical protein
MKYELGRCLLSERLLESGMTKEKLAQTLLYKPERLSDFMETRESCPLRLQYLSQIPSGAT